VFAAGQLANEGRLFELRRTSDRELLAEVGRASETGWADSLRFDPTGDLVAAAFEGFGLEVWRCATRSRIAELKAPSGAITDVRWSADGSFLMATSHERQVVRVYDRLAEWAMLAELEPRVQSRLGVGVNSGSIGPDGSVFLVPQGERGIDLWQLPPPVSAQLDD
jgi:dipeptidyl aminopeptidase/acylaminoacyl peptidase